MTEPLSIKSGVTLAALMAMVAKKYELQISQLTGPCRARQFARPRQIFYWLAAELGRWSSTQIGRSCGDRDHKTILEGVRVVKRLRLIDGGILHDTNLLLARAGASGYAYSEPSASAHVLSEMG